MTFAGIKVALVGPLPPPSGGMANLTLQLAERLQSAQAQVTLVQTNALYWPTWAGQIPGVRAVVRLVPYLCSLWSALGKCNVVHVMANSGWSWHLFAAPAIWIAKLRGVPVVVNYHGGEAAGFLTLSNRSVKFSMQQVAQLIVPSAFLQNVFARVEIQAMVVPNIIDLERFHPRDARSDQSAHLIVARNLEALYGNATALRAFQLVHLQYPEARLTIAGTGPEEQALRMLTAKLNLTHAVKFAGRLSRDAMATLYRTADLTLNPSLADNMPGSVLESLASGVPVVSSNVGGVPYMVQDGSTALLVPPANPGAMANACLKVLQDNLLWCRLSCAGLIEVQRYTWERVSPLLERVYRRAILTAKHSNTDLA